MQGSWGSTTKVTPEDLKRQAELDAKISEAFDVASKKFLCLSEFCVNTGRFTRSGVNYSQLKWQAADLTFDSAVIATGYGYFNDED